MLRSRSMRASSIAAALCLVGCGRVGFDAQPEPDASTEGDPVSARGPLELLAATEAGSEPTLRDSGIHILEL